MAEQSYWLKQSDTPLFPELIWSRPENKRQAGKLLIVGGTGQGFSAPAAAYAAALKAGVGTARVVLPGILQKTLTKLFPEAAFAPSTPSGSFAHAALAELCDLSGWADAVLLPGDIGRNSETEALLENFCEKYTARLAISGDAADIFTDNPYPIAHRPETLLVLTPAQLQKLAVSLHFPRAFTSTMGLVALVEALHEFTKRFRFFVVTMHGDQVVVALDGQVSTTTDGELDAAKASTWWLQNDGKPFEALTAAAYIK